MAIISGSAVAADLPARNHAPAPVAVTQSTGQEARFQGFYAGLGAGVGQSIAARHHDSGVNRHTFGAGRLRAGYNFQNGPLVVGAEAGVSPAFNFSSKSPKHRGAVAPTLADARLKLGFASDSAMIYGFGGVAAVRSSKLVAWTPTSDPHGLSKAERRSLAENGGDHYVGSSVKPAWEAGGGVEFAIDDNWSINAEAAYIDGGKRGKVANAASGKSDRASNVVGTIGVNYKF